MTSSPKDYLYITDLDGTLLEPGGTFSQPSMDRLNRLIDNGLQFSIATARSYDATHPVLKGVNLQLPVILFNGVYLTDFHTGINHHITQFIKREIVHDVMEQLEPMGLDPFIYTYGQENRLLHRRITNEGAKNYLESLEDDRRLCSVQHYEFVDGEEISGFLLIDRPEILDPVFQTLKNNYPDDLNLYFAEDIVSPGHYWLQAFHAQADKGSMVRVLADRLKVPLGKVVVFGDYLNDLAMFRVAGRAIAVDNALPEVKEEADEVITSNVESGVLTYLETQIFGTR